MGSYLLRNYDKRPSKKFPDKPKKQELNMAKRLEQIARAVEIKQPKQPNYWR